MGPVSFWTVWTFMVGLGLGLVVGAVGTAVAATTIAISIVSLPIITLGLLGRLSATLHHLDDETQGQTAHPRPRGKLELVHTADEGTLTYLKGRRKPDPEQIH